jgi:hypothetical protein
MVNQTPPRPSAEERTLETMSSSVAQLRTAGSSGVASAKTNPIAGANAQATGGQPGDSQQQWVGRCLLEHSVSEPFAPSSCHDVPAASSASAAKSESMHSTHGPDPPSQAQHLPAQNTIATRHISSLLCLTQTASWHVVWQVVLLPIPAA